MKVSTLSQICCPVCKSECSASNADSMLNGVPEIQFGQIQCKNCKRNYPILAGVALMVSDVHDYLMNHCIGIHSAVPVAEIPKKFRKDFSELIDESKEHPEWYEDGIESERVNQIYLRNHFYSVEEIQSEENELNDSYLISILKQKSVIDTLLSLQSVQQAPKKSVIEIGCSVGGTAYRLLKANHSAGTAGVQNYLGFDLAFRSVLWARHLILGASLGGHTPLSYIQRPASSSLQTKGVDFIVSDFESPAIGGAAKTHADLSLALNVIDLFDHPKTLAQIQKAHLVLGGISIQCSPYAWTPAIQALQKKSGFREPSVWIKKLYESEGFKEIEEVKNLPWVFYKGPRQLEVYSVQASVFKIM